MKKSFAHHRPLSKWWDWVLSWVENTGSVSRSQPYLILKTLCPQGSVGEASSPLLQIPGPCCKCQPLPVSPCGCGTGETDGTSHLPSGSVGVNVG